MKKKIVLFGSLFLFGALFQTGCDDSSKKKKSSPATTTQTQSATSSNPTSTSTSYVFKEDPDENETYVSDSEEIEIAENLLAKNYYVILDGSGSMQSSECSGTEKNKHAVSKKALSSFVGVLSKDSNLGLLTFDSSGISERLPLGPDNSEEFRDKVNASTTGGGTPLQDAIQRGYDKLDHQMKKQLGYGEYHMVIVTDGEANNGQEPDRVIDEILRKSPIVIHTLGFCIGNKHSLNQPGKTLYKTANNPEELQRGLKGVLAESEEFNLSDFEE